MLGIVFGAFVVLLFLGLPIAGSMIFSTLLPSFMVENFPGNLNYMLRAVVSGLDTMSILAIPLFMLSGAIMAQGGRVYRQVQGRYALRRGGHLPVLRGHLRLRAGHRGRRGRYVYPSAHRAGL